MTKTFRLLAMFLCLSVTTMASEPVSAASTAAETWNRVTLPAAGEAGKWVLAPGSDIKFPTMAPDGTVYAFANPSVLGNTLFKSTNSGNGWTAASHTPETLYGIAISPIDASTVFYATKSAVYKSSDAGKKFIVIGANPGGSGSGNISITSLGVAGLNGKNIIAVGTSDNDSLQHGGIYIFDENDLVPIWQDSGLVGYDTNALAFSPNYASDRQLIAVTTNETDTFIISKISSGNWSVPSENSTISGIRGISSTIEFPATYNASGNSTFFAGINTGTGNGDVYKIEGDLNSGDSRITDLNAGATDTLSSIDITGLASGVSGTGSNIQVKLLAGAADTNHVYVSADNGASWLRSTKEPTGQSGTFILKSTSFGTGSIAYAATSGLDSAFSMTEDGGKTWNQAGLIDTRIGSNGIIDLSVSPDYSRDGTLFMVTFDNSSLKHSLWRSRDRATSWQRVFSGSLPDVDELKMVEVSPKYGANSQVLFVSGTRLGGPTIWKSTDAGQTFSYFSVPYKVDAWTAAGDSSLYLAGYNGSNGLVYNTVNSGLSYSDFGLAGSQSIKSVRLSPDFETDRTILVGNANGWVYFSNDNGSTFKPAPLDAALPPLTGTVSVAFDANFTTNKIIYAAGNTANKGIFRFVIDSSLKWEKLDDTIPPSAVISQLIVSENGTLYAVNSQSVNATAKKGGVERSLNPGATGTPSFETLLSGLDDGAALNKLFLRGRELWAIDNANTAVMTFIDSLAQPVSLTTPGDGAIGTGTQKITLQWEALDGAAEYHWQLDYDNDFLDVPSNFEGTIKANSVRLPALDTDTTYFWRVQATKPVVGPWSNVQSFSTTAFSKAVVAPELSSPKAGAEDVSVKPLLQWSSIAGATGYDLMLAKDIAFDSPLIFKTGSYALPGTAWQIDITLEYNTAYYWKVRAAGNGNTSDWSAVGAFITKPVPAPATPAPTPTTPAATTVAISQTTAPSASVPSEPPAPETTLPVIDQPTQTSPVIQPAPSTPVVAVTVPVEINMPPWFAWVIGIMMAVIMILLGAVVTLLIAIRGR